jgi:hypothetical protein
MNLERLIALRILSDMMIDPHGFASAGPHFCPAGSQDQ